MEPRIGSWRKSERVQRCRCQSSERVTTRSRGCGCRKSDHHQHVTVACRQSFRDPLTQTPYINLDSNLFLLDPRVGHETAPHLAGGTPAYGFLLKVKIGFDEHNVCRREPQSSICPPAGAATDLLGARFFRVGLVGETVFGALTIVLVRGPDAWLSKAVGIRCDGAKFRKPGQEDIS